MLISAAGTAPAPASAPASRSIASIGAAATAPDTAIASPMAPAIMTVLSQTMVPTGSTAAPITRATQSASRALPQIAVTR